MARVRQSCQSSCICRFSLAVDEILPPHEPPLHGGALSDRLIADARAKMPDITLSSDIIVGFPGETDEDFEQTLRLVQDTRFDLLFTFLYSPRTGTPAASYEDNASPQDKQRRFERLLKTQDDIVAEKQAAYQGKTLRLLVDGAAKGPDYPYTARTEGNLLVCVRGENIQIGEFIQAEIEKTSLRCLFAVKKS